MAENPRGILADKDRRQFGEGCQCRCFTGRTRLAGADGLGVRGEGESFGTIRSKIDVRANLMAKGSLADYFDGLAVKTLSSVDAMPTKEQSARDWNYPPNARGIPWKRKKEIQRRLPLD